MDDPERKLFHGFLKEENNQKVGCWLFKPIFQIEKTYKEQAFSTTFGHVATCWNTVSEIYAILQANCNDIQIKCMHRHFHESAIKPGLEK